MEYKTFLDHTWIRRGIVATLLLLALFLAVQVVKSVREVGVVGAGIHPAKTVSIEGVGKVYAIPDIATVGFTVSFERATVAQAQEEATVRINEVVAYLKEAGIPDADIKTTSYSAYPQYDFIQTFRGGEQRLRGYQVSQTVSVKIRDTEKVGEILAGLGSRNVSGIFGPNFEVDDIDALRAEARGEAIAEAREKARILARDLGVRLVRVVGFWEDTGGYYPMYDRAFGAAEGMGAGAPVPSIPAGENEIISRVHVTYEIR